MVRIKWMKTGWEILLVLEGEAAIIISAEKARIEKGARIVIAGEMDPLNFSGLFGQAVREALKSNSSPILYLRKICYGYIFGCVKK